METNSYSFKISEYFREFKPIRRKSLSRIFTPWTMNGTNHLLLMRSDSSAAKADVFLSNNKKYENKGNSLVSLHKIVYYKIHLLNTIEVTKMVVKIPTF